MWGIGPEGVQPKKYKWAPSSFSEMKALENNKNNIQHQMENQHSYKIEQNYIKEADKGTAYHFSRNCNNKMDTGIEMIRTEVGKNMIERT